MALHGTGGFGPLDEEPTLRDISDDVDRLHQQFGRVFSELEEIKKSLENIAQQVADVQTTIDEKE